MRWNCSRRHDSFASAWATRWTPHWERSTPPRCGAIRAASTRHGRGSRRQAAYGVRLTTASAWGSSTAASAHSPAAQASSSSPASCSTLPARGLKRWVSEHDLIDTDARIAESLVLQERSRDALEIASNCLERTAAHGGDTHDPMLHRIRGYCLAQIGDAKAARAEFDLSLEIARARSARYEIALAQDAIARIAERIGAPDPERTGRGRQAVRHAGGGRHRRGAAGRHAGDPQSWLVPPLGDVAVGREVEDDLDITLVPAASGLASQHRHAGDASAPG